MYAFVCVCVFVDMGKGKCRHTVKLDLRIEQRIFLSRAATTAETDPS